jgi:hypothetical protein
MLNSKPLQDQETEFKAFEKSSLRRMWGYFILYKQLAICWTRRKSLWLMDTMLGSKGAK